MSCPEAIHSLRNQIWIRFLGSGLLVDRDKNQTDYLRSIRMMMISVRPGGSQLMNSMGVLGSAPWDRAGLQGSPVKSW